MDEFTMRMKSEIIDWKQALGNMSEENNLMKTRLSKMLQEDFNINLLPQIEKLYSDLLTEEGFINILRHNIGELDGFMESQNSISVHKNRFENLCSSLQSQLTTANIRLNALSSEFNTFFKDDIGVAPDQPNN